MKDPWSLRDKACTESYEYFSNNIWPLKKSADGSIDETTSGLHNNDVDAFRHAYVSGILTQEYSERTADMVEGVGTLE